MINESLIKELEKFEPTGYGNFAPVFITKGVNVREAKLVGTDGKHLKLKLSQNEVVFNAIWFNIPSGYILDSSILCDVAYTIETNTWNGRSQIQLKVKDIKVV